MQLIRITEQFQILLNKEYEELEKAFNFTEEDFVRFNLNAIDCALLVREKAELRVRLINGK